MRFSHAFRLFRRIVTVATPAILLAACVRREQNPLTAEVYVWQQVRTPELDDAVKQADGILDALHFHAADLSFRGNGIKVTQFEVPWQILLKSSARIGVVIRVPHADGGLGSLAQHEKELSRVIYELQRRAGEAGISLAEVQIDYDCPVSKLGIYAGFLTRLNAAHRGTKIVFTALPSWQRSPDFPRLAAATGRYVLQVHSLELPGKNDTQAVICDVGKARAALESASRLRVPFRVALPTYSCIVRLDADGHRLDVISEDGATAPPAAGGRDVRGVSDPVALAQLVSELKARRPFGLEGIVWFRLPVATDRMNWSWPTFAAVISGRKPVSRLEAVLVPQAGGASSVEVRNSGEMPEAPPFAIRISWVGSEWESADAVGGYRFEIDEDRKGARFVWQGDSLAILRPGRSLPVGWVRVQNPASLRATLE